MTRPLFVAFAFGAAAARAGAPPTPVQMVVPLQARLLDEADRLVSGAPWAVEAARAAWAADADTLGGFPVSPTPMAGALLPLGGDAKLPLAALPHGSASGLDADLLDGKDLASCCQDLSGSGSSTWSANVPANQWKMIHFAYSVGVSNGWKWGVDGSNVSVGTLSSHPNSQTNATSTIRVRPRRIGLLLARRRLVGALLRPAALGQRDPGGVQSPEVALRKVISKRVSAPADASNSGCVTGAPFTVTERIVLPGRSTTTRRAALPVGK
jgi:hypothetical protein